MNVKDAKKQTVKSIIASFKRNLFSIEYYYERFGGLAQGIDTDEIKKSEEFVETCFKEIGIDTTKLKIGDNASKIPKDKVYELIKKLKNQPKISVKNFEILSRSSFLMLNNYFEYLLSDLLSYHYNKFQKSLNEKKFNFALKDINEFETIEELTKALITREVESMMVEMTFDELLEHFHTTLEIDNEKELINWDFIRECRERRHIIVHNSSVVNKKYISRTKNPYNLKIGDTINVDNDYFLKSCREFYLAGLLLSYNSWGKWDKEDTNDAIYEIMVDSFDLLKLKQYELVSRFTSYAQKIEARNENQEDYLLRTKFNKLISLKKLSENGVLTKELKKIKIGTASPIFKLAYAILSDDHKSIIDLVKQAKLINELDYTKYQEWPIYDFVRENEKINSEIEKELKIIGAKKQYKKLPVQ